MAGGAWETKTLIFTSLPRFERSRMSDGAFRQLPQDKTIIIVDWEGEMGGNGR